MRIVGLIPAVVVAALLMGCQTEHTGNSNVNTLKICVSAAGDLTIDGQPVSLDQASAKMADLKKAKGVVLYYRENPQGEPHPNAMKVMKLVTEHQLPIRLCARPDFSDAVDEKGSSRSEK
jgi:biopolymer transport protein ExbD